MTNRRLYPPPDEPTPTRNVLEAWATCLIAAPFVLTFILLIIKLVQR